MSNTDLYTAVLVYSCRKLPSMLKSDLDKRDFFSKHEAEFGNIFIIFYES